MDERFYKAYFNHTTLHPATYIVIAVLGIASIVLPRRFALVPIILSSCFIAPAQRVVIFTLDFNLLRIMVLFGWTRLLWRSERAGFRWRRIDTVVILWMVSGSAAYVLLRGSMAAVIYKLGAAFDAVGMYFLFRCLIRSWGDVDTIIFSFIVVSIPVAIAFLVESATGRNAFAVFGGVPEFTQIRRGRLRCQGAFAHPILAGCFWASLMPLIAARWWGNGAARAWAVIGVVTSLVIIATCASSTPVMGVVFAGVAAGCFPLRRHLRAIRWCVFLALAGLHLVMKAPVWHLISRVDIVGGSTGWQRYNLIQQAMTHLGEWWLLGTRSTDHWGSGLYDVTNQYILEGVRGGLLTLVLFVCIIALAFAGVGRMVTLFEGSRRTQALSWALGVGLVVHCVSFNGVSYYGQIIVVWYMLLAIVGSLAPTLTSRSAKHAASARIPKVRRRVRAPGESVPGRVFRYRGETG